jgi:4-coumarate--CoA ligase
MTVLMNLYLAVGGLQVTLPRFEMEAALRLIQEHRVRQLYVAPPVVLGLAKHPLVDEFDLSSLEFVNSGAAPLGAELAEACAARIGCQIIQGYVLFVERAKHDAYLIAKSDCLWFRGTSGGLCCHQELRQ